jgi:hypothetical protein
MEYGVDSHRKDDQNNDDPDDFEHAYRNYSLASRVAQQVKKKEEEHRSPSS